MDLVVPTDRVKIKESEKKGKYLDLSRELRKQWNMWVTAIPIVKGALGHLRKIRNHTRIWEAKPC